MAAERWSRERAKNPLGGGSPMKRPMAVTIPAALLLAAPLLQLISVHFDVSFLNFGEVRLLAYAIYGIGAPVVGWMLWRMWPRARFAFYIFASCDLIRFWRHGLVHWEVPLIYGGLIAWLYTPAARAALPMIRPTDRLATYARLWPWRRLPPPGGG
jgi:hypothetical protein